jgi:hypothetical protein
MNMELNTKTVQVRSIMLPIDYSIARLTIEMLERISGEPCKIIPSRNGLVRIQRYTGSEWVAA